MSINFRVLLAIGCAISAAGCSSGPPSCSDPATQKLVKEALWEGVTERLKVNGGAVDSNLRGADFFSISIETIRQQSADDKSGTRHCAGILTIKMNDEAKRLAGNRFKQSNAADIEYASQLTEGASEHVVEVVGLAAPTEYLTTLFAMGAFKANGPTSN
jgi:hypothetical protein